VYFKLKIGFGKERDEEVDSAKIGIYEGLLEIKAQETMLPLLVENKINSYLLQHPERKLTPKEILKWKTDSQKEYGQLLYKRKINLLDSKIELNSI
jgi:hypothetical protein